MFISFSWCTGHLVRVPGALWHVGCAAVGLTSWGHCYCWPHLRGGSLQELLPVSHGDHFDLCPLCHSFFEVIICSLWLDCILNVLAANRQHGKKVAEGWMEILGRAPQNLSPQQQLTRGCSPHIQVAGGRLQWTFFPVFLGCYQGWCRQPQNTISTCTTGHSSIRFFVTQSGAL